VLKRIHDVDGRIIVIQSWVNIWALWRNSEVSFSRAIDQKCFSITVVPAMKMCNEQCTQ
jgi:hypothetical protein